MLNFDRQYEFTFFDINENNVVVDVKNVAIRNSVNFSFNYSISSNIFNIATFYFYNLSEKTANLFTSKNNQRGFYFRCSYQDPKNLKNSLLIRALTFRVYSYRVGPDVITEVTAQDTFINTGLVKVKNLNYPKNTTAKKIVEDISNYLGVFSAVSGTSFLTIKPTYNHPLCFNNVTAVSIITSVCSDNSCKWSYDVNGISITPLPNHPSHQRSNRLDNNIFVGETQLLKINRNSGLVGNVKAEALSAQMFPVEYFASQRLVDNYPFVSATILLRPVRIHSLVLIECETKELNGFYTVFSINYVGEYYGNSWFTNLKLIPNG